jgi:biotin carboxyl carrier protein
VTLRVLVSPGPGRLRLLPPLRFENGFEMVSRGQPVARLEQGRQDVILRSPVEGRVTAVLGLEGEPVIAGQAVMEIVEIGPELAS